MKYDLDRISKYSLEVEKYEIYKLHGHGTLESPFIKGETVRILECSEFDAFIITEGINIQIWDIISKRNSWEEPMYDYKKLT